jgi:hypothetical protein
MEILKTEAYIVLKKLQMLYDDYINDTLLLNNKIYGIKNGLYSISYHLTYFGVSLQVARFVKKRDGGHITSYFTSTRLFNFHPTLNHLQGTYKDKLEEILANFELTCQSHHQTSASIIAIATNDFQSVLRTFQNSNKLSHNLRLQASCEMCAGKASIELRTSVYWSSIFIETAFSGATIICLFMSLLVHPFWSFPTILLFIIWTYLQHR